jgi:membrane-associated phospholipid phosphatase
MTVALAPPRDDRLIGSSSVLRRWERGLLQIVTVAWVYTIYDELRAAATSSVASGMAHARQIVKVERVTGLGIERAVQEVTFHLPWLVGLCNVCYSATHLVVPPIVLAVLYRTAPDRYRQWRNVFLVLLGLSLLCFWLYPVLPPRLVPGAHRVADTSSSYFNVTQVPGAGIVTAATRSSAPQWAPFTNPMAAMPSLHVGWALWASLAIWPVMRRRWSRWVVAFYPLAMIWSVLVTGNHWLLDAVGGVAVVAVAYVATRVLSTFGSGLAVSAPTVVSRSVATQLE